MVEIISIVSKWQRHLGLCLYFNMNHIYKTVKMKYTEDCNLLSTGFF